MGTKIIKIAPDTEEIQVTEDRIHTDWNGGITYTAPGLTSKYTEDFLKSAFQQAIALSSRLHQMEYLLNDYLGTEGKVS